MKKTISIFLCLVFLSSNISVFAITDSQSESLDEIPYFNHSNLQKDCSMQNTVEADFYWLPENPRVGEKIRFFDTTQLESENIINSSLWDWDYDNDADEWGLNVTRRFSNTGEYIVSHWVESSSGVLLQVNKTVIVSEGVNPDFFYLPRTVTIGQKISFYDHSIFEDGEACAGSMWDFNNDGEIDERGTAINYTFWSEGNHYITHWAESTSGLITHVTMTVTVYPVSTVQCKPKNFKTLETVTGSISIDSDFYWLVEEPEIGETITFFDDSVFESGRTCQSSAWDFNNDGYFDAWGNLATFTFPTGGDYVITHVVENDLGETKQVQKTVSVSGGLKPNFYWLPRYPEVGERVTFYDYSIFTPGNGFASSTWDWENDGKVDEISTTKWYVVTKFFKPEEYQVSCKVGSHYNKAQVTKTVSVSLGAPYVRIEFTNFRNAPLGLTFSIKNTGNKTAKDLDWSIEGRGYSTFPLPDIWFVRFVNDNGDIDTLQPGEGKKIRVSAYGLGYCHANINVDDFSKGINFWIFGSVFHKK